MAPSSSGLGHRPFTAKITGSNPVGVTNTAPSSKGRTPDFDSVNVGSIPAGASIFNNDEDYIMSEAVAADELRLLIERVERLEEEKKSISDDIKDVYGEAKSRGYDTKIMKQIVRLRKMEKHARDEADAILDTYRAALGI